MKKSLVLGTLFVCLFSLSLHAQAVSVQSLGPSSNVPVIDGLIQANEYAQKTLVSGMTFAISLSTDGKTLFCAIEAPTTGWVAVGLGSLRMNGAYMVLAYDSKDTQVVSEETGRGHSHSANAVKKLIKSKVHDNGSTTVLEFALPAEEYLANNSLKILLAYGKKDDLKSLHAKHDKLELPISK